MKISKQGLSLIRQFEGVRLESYRCPAGVWTVGIGTTKNVKPGMRITLAQAEEMLCRDLEEFEAAIARSVKVPLTQNQFDSICSFVYNVGLNAFANSTLLKLLNQGKYKDCASQFERWNKVGGKVLEGLNRRRLAEKALFLS